MKTILAAFLTILLLIPVSALSEILTVTHTVRQTFGGAQSPDDARISARDGESQTRSTRKGGDLY